MKYQLKNLEKTFSGHTIIKNFSLELPKNKIISIMGPSGCGKTTLLNFISKILRPDQGDILGFENETIGHLFQEPRLLDWKTVQENIEFVLKDKISYSERWEKSKKFLQMVGLWEYKDFYPKNLSGGMKQRVSLARSFAFPSDVLLMDEPFKSLDFKTKVKLIYDFIKLRKSDQRSIFLVTHDIQASLMLGDEIYMLGKAPLGIELKIVNELPLPERTLQSKFMLEQTKKLYQYYN